MEKEDHFTEGYRKMKLKAVSGIMLTLLFVGMLTLAFNIYRVRAGGTIYIRPDGAVEGTDKIQRDGDVYIFTDNIYDSIVIEKDNVVVDGAGYTLQGTGTGTGIAGVYMSGRNNVAIKNAEIKSFNYGIRLDDSSDNIINGNKITDNAYGIVLHNSPNNKLRNNDASDNAHECNLWVNSWSLANYIQDIDESNTVNGNPVYYWVNRQDMTVPPDAGWIVLVGCTRITVKDYFNLTNGKGVLLASTTSSTIDNIEGETIWLDCSSNFNTISGSNRVSIYLYGSSSYNTISGNNRIDIRLSEFSNHNAISGNNITENPHGIGIAVSGSNNTIYMNNIANNEKGITFSSSSSYNVVFGNDITANDDGVYFTESFHNTFYHNNFINNVNQVHDWAWDCPHGTPSVNIWDDGYPSGGNYWSDHSCTGNPSDGSQPYVIDASNVDHYPFQHPIGPPTIVFLSPQSTTYATSSVPLTFTISEPVSWMGYSLDGGANATIHGNTTMNDLSYGPHTVIVYANDTVGHIGSSDMVRFIIDTTPPNVSILSPEHKTYDTTGIQLTFTADESVSWMAYSLDGQTNVTITGNTTLSGLSEGPHSLIVYARDIAGNTGASEIIFFTIEEAFPTLIVAAIVIVAVVGSVVFVYFLKFRK